VASGEENKEQERFLAEWADIIAGAMMKEKSSAHFARNDGRREGGCQGMERGHDVLRFHEGARRARCIVPLQEPEKTRGGKNRGREKQGDVEGLAGFAMAW
jgi:hypothetical protein